jgi:hypothetical protein
MTDENSLKLEDSDILTFGNDRIGEYTYKYKNFKSNFLQALQNGVVTKTMQELNPPVKVASSSWGNGISCELLRDGVEQKGKIRVVLEFIPDEVKVTDQPLIDGRSPLDEIRQIGSWLG